MSYTITETRTSTRPYRYIIVSALLALLAISFSLFIRPVNLALGSGLTHRLSSISIPTWKPLLATTTPNFAYTQTQPLRSLHTNMPSREDREWNRLADHMDQFHNHFRSEFNRVYTLADGGFHKQGMTLPRFLREAQQLSHHLDMHHRIESYIFPVLAKKMPQFKAGAREAGEHLKSHKLIHEGLDRYDKFLSDSLSNPSTYNPSSLREILDGFREVLFRHLDEEVHDLGMESMKAAGWTLDEIRRVPM